MNLQEAVKWCSDNSAYVFFRTQSHGEHGLNKSRSITVSLSFRGMRAEGIAIDLLDNRTSESMLIEAITVASKNFEVVKKEAKARPPQQKSRGQQGKDRSNPFDKNRGVNVTLPGKPQQASTRVILPGEKLAKATGA